MSLKQLVAVFRPYTRDLASAQVLAETVVKVIPRAQRVSLAKATRENACALMSLMHAAYEARPFTHSRGYDDASDQVYYGEAGCAREEEKWAEENFPMEEEEEEVFIRPEGGVRAWWPQQTNRSSNR